MTATAMSPAVSATPVEDRRNRPSAGKRAQSATYHAIMIVIVLAYIFPVAWAAVDVAPHERAHVRGGPADSRTPSPSSTTRTCSRSSPTSGCTSATRLVIVIFGTAGTLFSSAARRLRAGAQVLSGSNVLLALLLLTLMVPGQVTLIPQYVWFRDLGWIDTPLPIIVPLLFGTSIATFFFRQFFSRCPGSWRTRRHRRGRAVPDLLPRDHPAVRARVPRDRAAHLRAAVEQLLRQLDLPVTQDSWVLTQALQSLVGRYNSQYGEIMAGVTLVSVPIVIVLYLIFQRWIVRGIAMSGLAN